MIGKYDKLNSTVQWFLYFLFARHKKGHGIHSPSVFEFVRNVLINREKYEEYLSVEHEIAQLKNDKTYVTVDDKGAGSKAFSSGNRNISDITRITGADRKFGRLLFRIARYYKPVQIIELGTSVGTSTLYLAKGAEDRNLITIESNSTLVEKAKKHAAAINCRNIIFQTGLFDDILPELEISRNKLSLIYIDGNHTFDATLRYFKFFADRIDKGFIIIDDIYWSVGMERAWKEIKDSSVVSIDIYSAGIVLLGDMLTPGNYRIRF